MILLLSRDNVAIDFRDNEGRTPLIYAAACGHEATVRVLLNRGAIVDSGDNEGLTPLDWAKLFGWVDKDRKDAVVRLLEHKMREASSVPRKPRIEEVSDVEEVSDDEGN